MKATRRWRNLLAACFWATVLVASAQTTQPRVLYHFTHTNSNPNARLVHAPDGNLYGTTPGVSSSSLGSIFKLGTNGEFTTLVKFNGANGQNPWTAELALAVDGNFYGTTEYGGKFARGTVYRMTPEGVLTTLVHFDGANGAYPRGGGLTIGRDGNLYGLTSTFDMHSYYDTLFKVATNGDFTKLREFVSASPYDSLKSKLTIGRDGELYGCFYSLFKLTPGGDLDWLGGSLPVSWWAGLTLGTDGFLYSSTHESGVANRGTIFKANTNGWMRTLISFVGTNGANPAGPLTLGADGNFYGTTAYGGVFEGTVFRMTPGGTLTTLAHFTSRATGVRPYAGVTFGSDGSLYGTTYTGGNTDNGVLFRVDLRPTFLSQPASRFNGVGTTAKFMAGAFGTRPLSYQWFRDGISIPEGGRSFGASSNTLVIANTQPEDAGSYTLVVSNVAGSATSSPARLTVLTGRQSAVTSVPASDSGSGTNTVEFAGVPGVKYWVQFATNLTDNHWFTLATNIADAEGVWQIANPAASEPHRFYRVVAP